LSRSLVATAALAFALLCLAPVAIMVARIEGADLAALAEPRVHMLLVRTLLLGLGVAGGTLLLGVPLGFVLARTDVPGARLLRALSIAPLLLPSLVMAMTWTALVPLRGALATGALLVLSYHPLVALFTARAAERIDRRQEEAAYALGGLRAVLRADLGAVLPPALAGACLAFTLAVNDFSVPDFVSSVGPKFNVYAAEIFANWKQYERPGLAVASALPLLALTLGALVPMLVLRRRGAFAPLAASFQAPAVLPLRRLRWPVAGAVVLVLGASVGVPLGRLVHEAASGPATWRPVAVRALLDGREPPPLVAVPRPVGAEPSAPESEPALTLGERLRALPVVLPRQGAALARAFGQAFDRAREDLKRSLGMGAAAATIAVALGLVLGHASARARLGGCIAWAALVPLAVPGTLFGIGVATLWDGPLLDDLTGGASGDLYMSPTMAALLFAGRLCPFAILIASGAVSAVPRVGEWAAATVGAGPVRRLLRIVAPQIAGALAAGWICVFAFALRELDAALVVPEASRTAIVRVFNGVHFGRDEYVAALSLLLCFAILLPGLLWATFAPRRAEVLP
jgi:iron(III) transport system permease protein